MHRSIASVRFLAFGAFLIVATCPVAHGKAELKTERIKEIAATLLQRPKGLGEPITNRVAWDSLASAPGAQQWLNDIRGQVEQPFPTTSDDLFLDFSRTGNRDRWQNVAFARRARVSNYAAAECLENKGKFLPALEAAIREICAEPTWILPAHDRTLRNFEGPDVDIDLGSSRIGWTFATIDYVFGDKLSSATRALIREKMEERIFKPYRDMVQGAAKENPWLRVTHNWNSVCHAGVVGSALAMLESKDDRALFIAAAEFYMPYFLKGFGTDGYCSEGMGYWNYGFGHYVMLTETVRQATGGKIDFFSDPAATLPALFGERAEIINGIYPSIADCPPGAQPDGRINNYVCRRLQQGNCDTSKPQFSPTADMFSTMLFSFLPEKLPVAPGRAPASSRLRTWFFDGGVLICRPGADAKVPLAVSLKGGHNAEHHNHNDLGSFIVVAGKASVLVDPGSEVYTARTFGKDRYQSDVLNSFGHSVPLIGGKLQRSGAQARAVVVRTNFSDAADTLVLDLTSAYPVPALQKLERSFLYRRGGTPSLTVTDVVEMKELNSFETALLTFGDWQQVSSSEFLFKDAEAVVRVKIDTGAIPFEVKSKQLEADVGGRRKATRIGLVLNKPVTNATVTMTITAEAPVSTK